MNNKIKVKILDLDKSSWFRRPVATLDTQDTRLECEYLYLFPNECDIIPIKSRQLNSLHLDADYVIIFAYRIPELILIQANPDITFLYVQHGYYPNFLKRDFLGIFRKLDRIKKYLMFLVIYFLFFQQKKQLVDIVKLWIAPKHQASTLRSPSIGFVFDEQWEQFHRKKLGWTKTQYKQVKFYEPKEIQRLSTFEIQYVAQTLVEDGRLSKKVLIDVLNKYVDEYSVKLLCILGHPRTDESIYHELNCEYVFEYNRCFEIPTIGHYSSLMLYLAENQVDVSIIGSDQIEIPQDFYDAIRKSRYSGKKQYTNDRSETYLNHEIT